VKCRLELLEYIQALNLAAKKSSFGTYRVDIAWCQVEGMRRPWREIDVAEIVVVSNCGKLGVQHDRLENHLVRNPREPEIGEISVPIVQNVPGSGSVDINPLTTSKNWFFKLITPLERQAALNLEDNLAEQMILVVK
jgi:hypothetical protein